ISAGDNRWAQLNDQARERQVPVHVVEEAADGVTQAHIGAHLLSLWGLPDGIVEAVAHHHDPAEVDGLAFDGVAAVHIANGLANELHPATEDEPPAAGVTGELLDRLGPRPRRDVCRQRAPALAAVAA